MANDINFTSLSSSLQTKLIASDWVVASRYELRELSPLPSNPPSPQNIPSGTLVVYQGEPPSNPTPQPNIENYVDNILNTGTQRGYLSYHTHHLISSVVRTLLNFAVCSVFAPMGLLWHTGAALFYQRKGVTRLSDRHWACAGVELIKVVVVISCVALPFLLKRAYRLKIEKDLPSGYAFMGFLLGLWEIWTTLFNPAFNSRQMTWKGTIAYFNPFADRSILLKRPSKEEAEWLAQMALKWELGVKPSPALSADQLLTQLINTVVKRRLSIIAELQKILPPKHRLPFDPKADPNDILRYLEESREDLIQEEKWEAVNIQRNLLIQNRDLYDHLISYNSDKKRLISEQEATEAYTAHRTITLVKTRPVQDLRIYSLTLILFKKMLESPWFYPPNYESQEIKDEGSLEESMREIDPYQNRRPISSQTPIYLKPVRYLARSIGSIVVLGVGIPGGLLYNGLQALRYGTLTTIGDSGCKFGNWEKTKAYALAALSDFISLFYGILTPFYQERLLGVIAHRENMRPFFTSFTLKSKFGISGPGGQLLSYHNIVDDNDDAVFQTMFKHQSLKLWQKLSLIYSQLDAQAQGTMTLRFSSFCLDGNFSGLMTWLKSKDNIPVKILEECDQIFEDLLEMRGIRYDAFLNAHWLDDQRSLPLRNPFPYFDFIFKGFGNIQMDPWQQLLKKYREEIKGCRVTQENPNQAYQSFKARVLDLKVQTPRSIIGLDQDSFDQNDVNKACKKISIFLHPDKVEGDEAVKEEAKKLFQLVQAAKTILTEELKNPKPA